jgi:hypothetical protein
MVSLRTQTRSSTVAICPSASGKAGGEVCGQKCVQKKPPPREQPDGGGFIAFLQFETEVC